jgi:hypothetical protein
MSTDLTYRVPTVGSNTVTKALSAIANRYNALGVSVPRYVIYATGNNVIFT